MAIKNEPVLAQARLGRNYGLGLIHNFHDDGQKANEQVNHVQKHVHRHVHGIAPRARCLYEHRHDLVEVIDEVDNPENGCGTTNEHLRPQAVFDDQTEQANADQDKQAHEQDRTQPLKVYSAEKTNHGGNQGGKKNCADGNGNSLSDLLHAQPLRLTNGKCEATKSCPNRPAEEHTGENNQSHIFGGSSADAEEDARDGSDKSPNQEPTATYGTEHPRTDRRGGEHDEKNTHRSFKEQFLTYSHLYFLQLNSEFVVRVKSHRPILYHYGRKIDIQA